MGEIIFLLILIVLSVLLFGNTFTLRISSFDTTGGAAVFPRYILLGIILCSIVLIIQKILLKKKDKDNKEKFVFIELFKNVPGVFLLSFVIYLILLNLLGFILSSILYLIFMTQYLLKKRGMPIGSIKIIALRICLISLSVYGIYYLFNRVFRIMLPEGIFF